MKKYFREVVTERIGSVIISSDIIPATDEEVSEAKTSYVSSGSCDHSLIYDEDCWPYSLRMCAVCGKGLGTV